MANTATTSTTSTADDAVDQIDLMVKEDENVLRRIIENSAEENIKYVNDEGNIEKKNLLSFLGTKVGKIYNDLMMKLTILKMDLYSFHVDFQDFLVRDTEYKDANDLDKLNIKAEIKDFKLYLGTIEDFRINLK
jgi:hypothetical protein